MLEKIIFRAEGNEKIGLGHLVRCVALAQMLKDDFDITFISIEAPESIVSEISQFGFLFMQIDDEEEFFAKLTGNEIVVIDHYQLDSEYQKRVKNIGCKLVCIDDLHDRQFHADLIINHAPGVKREDYKAQPWTKFALGTDYALLRPAFLKQAKQSRIIDKVENVFICFGGSDQKNLTFHTLKKVLAFDLCKKIIVVTGSSYKHLDTLLPLIQSKLNVLYYHEVSDNEMLGFMLQTDVAIVPASGILFEAIAAGCKVISGTYVDNQQKIHKGFLELGAIIDAQEFEGPSLEKALYNINRFIPKEVIDGNSDKRLKEAVNSLVYVSANSR